MIDSSFEVSSSVPAHTDADSADYLDHVTHVRFHIDTGDYFRYLSTLLGFCEEAVEHIPHDTELGTLQQQAIRSAREDLAYLHEHYRIEPR